VYSKGPRLPILIPVESGRGHHPVVTVLPLSDPKPSLAIVRFVASQAAIRSFDFGSTFGACAAKPKSDLDRYIRSCPASLSAAV
jgi:hypothetical protein